MKIQAFLAHSPVFAFYLAARDVLEEFQTRLARHEVHLLQGFVLTALFFEGREVRPSELSAVFQVDRSTMSHALRGLEKKGWVRRSLHPSDARGYLLALTPAGRRKAVILVKEFDTVQAAFETGLGTRRTREVVEDVMSLMRLYKDLPEA